MSPTSRLEQLANRELLNVPIDKWGYFFPFMLAIWHYLEDVHPGTVGELRARYSEEPELVGSGADWFCGVLMNEPELLDLVEKSAYSVVDRLPKAVRERGFVAQGELPDLDPADMARLEEIIAREVRRKRSAESSS